MYSKRSIASTLVLISLISVGSWWSIHNIDPSTHPKLNVTPTAIAKTLHIVKMGPKGHLHYHISVQDAIHYSDNHDHAKSVYIDLFSEKAGTPPWKVHAKQALKIENHQIKLYDHVIITRDKYKDHPLLKITTSTLFLNPKTKEAFTDAPVTLSQPAKGNITHAVGLKANLEKKTFKLLSNVSSTYEPEK